jgi:phage terminase large subunit-like protein
MRKPKAAKKKVPDRRPWKTTANPEWAYAENPVDLIPATDDPHGRGAMMVRLVGSAIITQGPAAGQRFSEVMLPWQEELVRYIFGETDKHGRRIVQRVGLLLGKGSGKTSFAAAIAQAVIMDSYFRKTNARGLVVILAANIPSAGIAFQSLQESIASDAELVPQFRTYTARRAIRHLPTGIECRVISP